MKRGKIILLSLVVVVLGFGGWYIHSLYSTFKELPNAYSAWASADLIIDHMKAHEGQWPRSWDDLRRTAEIREALGLQVMWEFDELPQRVLINFDADPQSLAQASPNDEELPFHVVRRHDGKDFPVVWQHAEPNQMILDYLLKKRLAQEN